MKWTNKTKLLLVLFLSIMLQYSCNSQTPKKYQNNSQIPEGIYNRNKNAIIDSIKELISKNSSAYYSSDNDSNTQVFVDTILYSPSKDRIAFFVITKNTNDKPLSNESEGRYYYDAHCFIAYLDEKSNINEITWIDSYNLTTYRSYKETSHDIRKIYFEEFAQKGTNKEYNLNDVRFWKSSLWEER